MEYCDIKELVKDNNVKDLVKDQMATFTRYQDGNLYYITTNGFEFPIPMEDTKGAVFSYEHRAINLMRWVRKHVDLLNNNSEVV